MAVQSFILYPTQDSVSSYGALGVFIADTAAELPTTALAGNVGFAADSKLLYHHDGTGWVAKVDTSDSRLSNTRTPNAHATTHKSGGSDVINLNEFGAPTASVLSSRCVVCTDDTKGFVMKSPNGHYWLLSISDLGVITWTDVGTSPP